MRRYQKGMVLMVEHILFAVLTDRLLSSVLLFLCGGLKITMKKQILEMKKKGTKLL